MWGGTAVSYAPLCHFGRFAIWTGICICVGIRCVRRGENLHRQAGGLSRGTWLLGAVIRS